VDLAGNVLVSDGVNARVRAIAVASSRFYGRRMTAGHIYTIAGGGKGTADGILATRAAVSPYGLAVDRHGNVVIASGSSGNLQVVAGSTGTFYRRKMTRGHIYTLTGKQPSGVIGVDAVAVDRAGNLVATAFAFRHVVKVRAVRAGRFYGRPMTAGHFYAVAVDAAGNLLIADIVDARIRVVVERAGWFYGKKMRVGCIYTVADSGPTYLDGFAGGFSGDGGSAARAVLFAPCGVAPWGQGLVLLDSRNNRVRAVSG